MDADKQTLLMLIARRVAVTAATFAIAHGAIAADQQGAAVEIGVGVLVWLVEFILEWWRNAGMVMVKAQLARIKGIPLPHNTPTVPAVIPLPSGGVVEVKSVAA